MPEEAKGVNGQLTMEFDEKNIALFDAYLRNEMNEEEKASFEQSLAKDEALAAEFEAFKLFEETIEQAEIRAFKDQLSRWEEPGDTNKTKPSKIISIRYMALAASIAVACFLTVTYFFSSSSNQELATRYFTPYENVITVRGEKEEMDAALLKYDEKQYDEALKLFVRYPDNPTAVFYAGECEFALEHYEKAVPYFEKTLNSGGIFSETAAFHLSLAYLGAEKETEARTALEAINADSDYYQDAQLLLEELN